MRTHHKEMGKPEEEFWKSVMKFLQAEKEAGNKEFGNICETRGDAGGKCTRTEICDLDRTGM